jgi:hypothetical protein
MIAEENAVSVAAVVGLWAHLLEHASKDENRGSIAGIDMHLTAYTLMIKPETVETVCNAMKRARLVTETGEITKWVERQAKRENQEPSGASTKRVQAMRERKKALENNDLGDTCESSGDETLVTDETTCNDAERPKRKKKKESKTEPKNLSSPDGDGTFDRFWNAYPRKVGKVDARKAWDKANLDATLVDTILLAIEAQKDGGDWREGDGKYIPHPASWIRGGRWLDEVRPYVEQAPKLGAWWATKDSMTKMGLSLNPPLTPLPGEYPKDFQARINAALDPENKPERREPAVYVPPQPTGGEKVLSLEQRQARLEEMKATLKAGKQT